MRCCKSLAEWIDKIKGHASDFAGEKCNDVYINEYWQWTKSFGHKIYCADYISFIDNLCAATNLKVYVVPDGRGWPTYEMFDWGHGYDTYKEAWCAADEADRENYLRELRAQRVTSNDNA